MEGSFDQELLVFERKEPQNVHNKKPLHMSSIAGGIRKRLQDSIHRRKSVRLSGFDQGRDIPQEVYPTPIKEVQSEAQLKVEHRRQQLEKWKLEKAQKKKEEAMIKKKPFVAGIPHAPLYVLPPPPPKTVPSTSGRVTRSTARKAAEPKVNINKVAEKKIVSQPSSVAAFTKSFAPKNATFKPPKLKTSVTLPPFTALNRNKAKNTITFNPIVHPTRPNANTSSSVSSSEGSSTMLNDKPKRKFVKTPVKFAKHMTSSSDSDTTTVNFKRNVQNRAQPRKVQLTTQTSSDTNSSDNSSSSKQAYAKQTKKVVQTKPLQRQVQVTKSEPIRRVNESPKMEKRPTRAAKQKALTSIEQQRANKNKTIKTVLSRVIEQSPQVVIEPLVIEKTKPRQSIAKSTGENTPKKTERKSVSDRNSTPRKPIPKSESSSEEKIRLGTPKNGEMKMLGTPNSLDSSSSASNISPFVCMSRGKDKARREMIQKAREGLLGEELEAEEDSVSYFRQLLDSEIQNITLACDRWDSIYEEVELPEFVQGLVLSAVGQGRLLMAQKFRQFLSLIDRCASAEANIETVTVTDLRGFWDMIYLQVKNIHLRFSELEELRAKSWSLELHQSQQRPGGSTKTAGDAAKKKTAVRSRKSRVTAGPSKIKELIAAARKAKQQQESDTNSTATSTTTLLAIPDEEKTFEAGFFSVRSPIRSPTTPSTPAANRSLLKSVLSSEARKACGSCSKNTPNAMLRASILGKNVQIEGVTPLEQTPKPIPINLNATPARSILKSGKKQSLKKSSKKSVKTVLFDQNESDESILASNLTSVCDPMGLTTELDKENNVIYLSSTDSVQIIDSLKKTGRKSSEVMNSRQSSGNFTEIASSKKSSKKSTDLVETTRKSDVKSTETSKSTGRKSVLRRQNALTNSPLMTRRQRKSLQPFLVDDLSPQNSALKELDNSPNSTSIFNVSRDFVTEKPTPRRSKRLTQINSEEDDLIKFNSPVKMVAKRSSKRRVVN